MNNRTVIRFVTDTNGGVEYFFLDKSPNGTQLPALTPWALSVVSPVLAKVVDCAPCTDAELQAAGLALFTALGSNVAVASALTDALQVGPSDCRPIFVHIQSDAADLVPWEMLHHGPPNDFLALDARWPIARIVGMPNDTQALRRYFDPPLRIVAVMAAAKISSEAQWQALYSALKALPAALPWKLNLLVCEQTLQKQVADLADARISVELLLDADHLLRTLDSAAPHFAHFFCHGSAPKVSVNGAANATDQFQAPALYFANRLDWETEDEIGSIRLEAKDLWAVKSLREQLWLLTLNSCEGGASTAGVTSMARSLVEKRLPAVLGMRAKIAPELADKFCAAFYNEVLAKVVTAQSLGGSSIDVEWAQSLYSARRSIKGLVGADVRTWTLPVLYVLPEMFQLSAPSKVADPAERQRLEDELQKLKQARATLGDMLPPGALAELEGRIRQLGAQLYA